MGKAVADREKIEREAADWAAAIDCGTADRDAFDRWRAADPAHALAFIRISQVSRGLDVLRETRLIDDGVPLSEQIESNNQADAVRSRPSDRRRFLGAGLGALGLGVLGLGWSVMPAAAQEARTGIGERRRIFLAKGVSVDLNTSSRIRWRGQAETVEVDLLEGEILVERDPASAACSIVCRDVQIGPTVGRLSARLRDNAVEVAVLRGEALIRSSTSESARRVASLERTVVDNNAQPVVTKLTQIQAAAAEAWQRGEVQFNGEPLSTAVAEYNRYLSRPLVIADPSISHIQLGGRFSNSDPSDFLNALLAIYGVRSRAEAGRVLLSRT